MGNQSTGLTMKFFLRHAWIIGFLSAASACPSALWAAAQDYEFQLVKSDARSGAPAEITVRLLHKPDNQPVSGAVIFASKVDMVGMEDMKTAVEKLPASEPGIYKFRTTPSMAGDWTLHLAAKVQGEAETVQGSITFRAKP